MATSPSYHGNFSDREQPTLLTVANYIAEVRIRLQDMIPEYRYKDDSLLTALNLTLLEAYRLRSDLFVFNDFDGQVQSFTNNDDTVVDMETPFRLAILHGMMAHALERDQEDVQDSRASSFFGMFNAGLVGHGIGPVQGGSPPQGRRSER